MSLPHNDFVALLEPLESRIAPANLLLSTTGLSITKDGAAVNNNSLGAMVGVDTAVLLRAGDTLLIDGGVTGVAEKTDDKLVSVTSGFAWVFFKNVNANSIWEQNEISGIAFGAAPGKTFAASVLGDVNGSIVGTASETGILAGNDLSLTQVSKLTITGSVAGRLLAGGSVSNVSIAGTVSNFSISGIEVGTAALTNLVLNMDPEHLGEFISQNESYTLGGSSLTIDSFTSIRAAGASGASVSDVHLTAAVNKIEAGDGVSGLETSKAGGNGGSVSDLVIDNAYGADVLVIAGKGADGGADPYDVTIRTVYDGNVYYDTEVRFHTGKGGSGGSISSISATNIGGLGLTSGSGGTAPEGGSSAGGAGGSISKVTITQPAAALNLTMVAGAGGDSTSADPDNHVKGGTGGASGSISSVSIVSTAISEVILTAEASFGGAGAKSGAGGSISGISINVASASEAATVHMNAGGSVSTFKSNISVEELIVSAGGSISGFRLAGGTIALTTEDAFGEGGEESSQTGGDSGGIRDIVSTGVIKGLLKTGTGGAGSAAGAGGDAGAISGINFATVDHLAIETGAGGSGGFFELYIDPVENEDGEITTAGRSIYKYGAGGNGGSVSKVTLDKAVELSVLTGDGGITSYKSKSGSAGSIDGVTVTTGLSGSGYFQSGVGGSSEIGNVTGGSGGAIKNVKLTLIDAFPLASEVPVAPVDPVINIYAGGGGSSAGKGSGGAGGSVSGVTLTVATSSQHAIQIYSGSGGLGSSYETGPEDDTIVKYSPGGDSGAISKITVQSLNGSTIGNVTLLTGQVPEDEEEDGGGDGDGGDGDGDEVPPTPPPPVATLPADGGISGIKITTAGTLKGFDASTYAGAGAISDVTVNAGSITDLFHVQGKTVSKLTATLNAAPAGVTIEGAVSGATLVLGTEAGPGAFGDINLSALDSAGGSISKVKITAGATLGTITLQAAEGDRSAPSSSGFYTGLAGGSVTGFTLTTPAATGLVTLKAGIGGDGYGPGKNGGKAGSISDLTLDAPLTSLALDNNAAKGGASVGGTGGLGGSISNIKGILGGITVTAGAGGGSSLYTTPSHKTSGGKGGNGGAITNIALTNMGVVVGSLTPGAGGDGITDGLVGLVTKISIPGYVPPSPT